MCVAVLLTKKGAVTADANQIFPAAAASILPTSKPKGDFYLIFLAAIGNAICFFNTDIDLFCTPCSKYCTEE